jgi:anti-sigma regulatory factor (Ser/Thr protein kinase)
MRADLRLSCDDRLIAGVGGAIAHFAERAGLEDTARNSLAAALEELCRQKLLLLHDRKDMLNIAIADFEDRIEIIVEHRGNTHSPTAIEAFAPVAAQQPVSGRSVNTRPMNTRLMQTAVDRVEYQTQNGSMRTILVKYLGSRNGNS